MTAEEHVRAGRLAEALAALQGEVKKRPSDPKLRTFLFQILAVQGQWDRALTQLSVVSDLDPSAVQMHHTYRELLQCEALRAEVFAGRRAPLIFGEPAEWMALLLQAVQLDAQGKFDEARPLRERAFDEAPATAGTVDGKPFAWIADADSRLGPMLELILEGKYYWVPFCRIKRIALPEPSDLRDLIWIPAQFVWSNGGEASGHIPARYIGSESSSDGSLRLARKTEWQELA